ncbi:glycosyltransferase [Clostridium sporogenes]
MKVLHLLSSNKFSGAENVVCQMINIFKGEIDMLYCSPYGQIEQCLFDKNIKYSPIKTLSTNEIKRVIKEYEPDIIHAHDVRASIFAALSTNQISIVSHIHGNFGNTNRNFSKSLLYRLFLSKFSKVIVVSESIVNEYMFSNKLKQKCVVLYNIIDIQMVLEKMKMDNKEYDFDCIFLGRLTYAKNPERLISITKHVVKKYPNIKLGIIGDGELRNVIQNQIIKEDMENNIKMMGFMENPYKILSQCKLVIMCSRYEGTPMAILEAMALGIPIVSTPVDGLKNIIENGVQGFLDDNDLGLAEYICNILLNYKLHKRMSQNAKEKAKEICDINKYKEAIKKIYNEL